MRNKCSNNPGFWSLMIVLTLGSWQQSMACQTTRTVSNRLNVKRVQDAVNQVDSSAAATQVESIPAPDEPRPELFVDDRFTGWQAAGSGEKAARLADELRANWVMVDDNGLLAGQILGLKSEEEPSDRKSPNGQNDQAAVRAGSSKASQPKMNVYLLNRGRLLGTARLNAQDRFEFQGVKPGNYALVGYGKSGFFAFGFNVIPFAENSQQPRELYVPALASSGKSITDWVTANAPDVRFRPLGKHRFGQGKDDPPRLYGINGLRIFLPEAEPATSIVSHPAGLTAEGKLLGRVHHVNSMDGRPVDLRTIKVQILQQEKVVQQTGTDNFGVFDFSGVEPGSYELRVSGPDGLAAIQIEVVNADDPKALPVDLSLISSETIGWLNHFMIESAYMTAISGPRPSDRKCDRCGQRCPNCGGCNCADHPCRCAYGLNGGYGGYGDDAAACPCGGNHNCPHCHGGSAIGGW